MARFQGVRVRGFKGKNKKLSGQIAGRYLEYWSDGKDNRLKAED